MELHHFADASSKRYGTVSYLRIIDEKGKIYCSFLYAKARLAPLKTDGLNAEVRVDGCDSSGTN